jgi:hypothetical protein
MRCHLGCLRNAKCGVTSYLRTSEAIHAAARRHCPTSPLHEGQYPIASGKGALESARAMFRPTHGMNTGRGYVRIPLPLLPRLLQRRTPRRRRGPSVTTRNLIKEVTRAYVCLVRQCRRRWRQRAVQLRFFTSFWIA